METTHLRESPPARTGALATGAAAVAGLALAGVGASGIAFDIVGGIMAAIAAVTGESAVVDLGFEWPMAAARAAALAAGTTLLVTAVRRRRRARGACARCGRPADHDAAQPEGRDDAGHTSPAGGGRGTWPARGSWQRLSVRAGYLTVLLAAGYGALKVQWGLGGTFGLADPRAFGDVHLWTPGLGDTGVLALIGMALGLGFARTWRPPLRMPRWMPLTAAFVGSVMLVPVGVLGTGLRVAVALGLAKPSLEGVSPWVFDVIYPWFLAWGLAMGTAAVGYHYRTRGVCRACGRGRPAFVRHAGVEGPPAREGAATTTL
ncbi:UNVERIFIED_ORG: ribosomal protein L37E [Microbispora rosea subsp. rosea]